MTLPDPTIAYLDKVNQTAGCTTRTGDILSLGDESVLFFDFYRELLPEPYVFTWRGIYSDSVQYYADDLVSYLVGTYMALSKPPLGTNPGNETYWLSVFTSPPI